MSGDNATPTSPLSPALRELMRIIARVAMRPASSTVSLEDAAALLHVSEAQLADMVRAGEVRGEKRGRRWVFARADLIELVRAKEAAAGKL